MAELDGESSFVSLLEHLRQLQVGADLMGKCKHSVLVKSVNWQNKQVQRLCLFWLSEFKDCIALDIHIDIHIEPSLIITFQKYIF